MTPSEYGGLLAGGTLGKAKELETAAATFLIPTEIATNRDDVAKYAEQLEFCVRNGFSAKEFVQRCNDEGLAINEQSLHIDLYNELVRLDRENKNGVWARIIKNSFAPLFVGRTFDFIAGNPPWVNWNNLPAHYRKNLIELNQHVYDLFPHKGVRARHGSASIDISTLFVYVGADKYLRDKGRLGFVITQSVFKSSGGSEGFRRFKLPNGVPLGVTHVDDFSNLQPFEGAQNRTAVLCIARGLKTNYPLRYLLWQRESPHTIESENEAPSLKAIELTAWPVQSQNRQSPWITMPSTHAAPIRKVLGDSPYEAKLGVHTWLNGAYWLVHDEVVSSGQRLVVNAHDIGKKKVKRIETVLEGDLVYPLVRGRDVHRWFARPNLSIIVPHSLQHPGVGISESVLKNRYHRTFDYFQQLRRDLEGRSGFIKFIRPAGGPFYAVYNIGSYTFKPFKVVWREQASSIQACVIARATDGRLVMPDHKLTIIGFDSEREAQFICGLLNSAAVQFAVAAYSIEVQISTHVTNMINLPQFEENNDSHKHIAELARLCQDLAEKGDVASLRDCENQIDAASAKVWGISSKELLILKESLTGIDPYASAGDDAE